MDQKKTASVFDWPKLENFKNVQNFLGFAIFYKRFIKDFSKHAAPLNALVKKDKFFPMGAWPAKGIRWFQNGIHYGPNFVSFWPQ